MRRLRYTIRKLARTPLFTTVAVFTLALGIGANTAVFSVVNSVLLEPLSFDEPDELIGVWHTAPGIGFDELNQSPALYFTYREESEVFAGSGMWSNSSVSVTGREEPEQVSAIRVTDGVFPLLRVQPHVGRLFSVEDDRPGTPHAGDGDAACPGVGHATVWTRGGPRKTQSLHRRPPGLRASPVVEPRGDRSTIAIGQVDTAPRRLRRRLTSRPPAAARRPPRRGSARAARARCGRTPRSPGTATRPSRRNPQAAHPRS